MEEQALYRAILGAPHDDTARVVYADWLDENADRFPAALARAERARAEFIRVQCALARRGPGGWDAGAAGAPDPESLARQKRLLFQHGKKWRRAFSPSLASAPFDRGFLRPCCSLRPQEVLALASLDGPTNLRLLPLSSESPARRYVPDDSAFNVCPLWDIHLYAPDYQRDAHNDRGQYGDLLAEVGRSPALARVGRLKVSFFRTPVFEFLRTGNFANVETLVLNSGPFPQVLDAVAENESFRSLRYVRFGTDGWAWSPTGNDRFRFASLVVRLDEANRRHVPHGEMRAALRAILRELPPLPPPAPPPSPPPPPLRPLRMPEWAAPSAPAEQPPEGPPLGAGLAALGLFLVGAACAGLIGKGERPPLPPKFNYNPDLYKVPPAVDEFEKWRAPPAPPVPVAPPGSVGPLPERKK